LVIKQILKTLKYLHSKGICHRDLKPENIMINPRTLHVKIIGNLMLLCIDFGLATFFKKDKPLTSRVGSPYYIAPEVLKAKYNKESDVWSVGIIAYVMLTGGLPFTSDSLADILEEIQHKKLKFYKEDWKYYSKHALNFVMSLLEKDPAKRLTTQKALDHKFIKRKEFDDRCIHPKLLEKLATTEKGPAFKNEVYMLFTTFLKKDVMEKINERFQDLDKEGRGFIEVESTSEFDSSFITSKTSDVPNIRQVRLS
jgi:serine/threonine protein kinase